MLIAFRCKANIEEVKVLLEREFEMKNLGVASKILGMQITRDRVLGVLCVDERRGKITDWKRALYASKNN